MEVFKYISLLLSAMLQIRYREVSLHVVRNWKKIYFVCSTQIENTPYIFSLKLTFEQRWQTCGRSPVCVNICLLNE